jgi:hypothetical protein
MAAQYCPWEKRLLIGCYQGVPCIARISAPTTIASSIGAESLSFVNLTSSRDLEFPCSASTLVSGQ